MQFPNSVKDIITRLSDNGYEAYAVGGCVRDSLLELTPKDWDVCTNAVPDEVCALFDKVLKTGVKHGTVTVLYGADAVEVTTFRRDGEYTDRRRPDSVSFVSELETDLSRRDFTINAMAMDTTYAITDPFGGREDLRNGIVRCVGEPNVRFNEDALRIIRALRFASVLGFLIEEETARSIRRKKSLLRSVSAERINRELSGLLMGKGVLAVLLSYSDILGVIIPEILPMTGFLQHNPWHVYDVWEHSVRAVAASEQDLILRLTLLLHDCAKPDCFTRDKNGVGHFYGHPKLGAQKAERILARLRYDNTTSSRVKELIEMHDRRIPSDTAAIKKMLRKIGAEQFFTLLNVKRADRLAHKQVKIKEELRELAELEHMARECLEAGQAFRLCDLKVNGADLIALGIPEGKAIGETLEKLLEMVITGKSMNDRTELIDAAKRLML